MNLPAILAETGPATRSERHSTIVLIADETSARTAQSGALSAMRDSGHALCLFEGRTDSPWLLDELRQYLERHRPLGAIVLPPLSAVPGLAYLCEDMDCIPVRLSPCGLAGEALTLCSNDRLAAADATQYLIALGHRRIGLICGSETCLASRACELGFIDALAAHELDRGAELVATCDGSFAAGEEASRLLLEISPRPSAILTSSDVLAASVLKVAQALGIAVPGALSIVGFGDTPLAAMLPTALTSVRLPDSEMAFAAAIELIGTSQTPQPAEFFGTLVPRASSGPAAQ